MSEKYWFPHKLQVRVVQGDDENVIELDHPFAVIGSHRGCDVVVPDMPARKYYVHALSEGIYYVDLEDATTKNPGQWLEPNSSIDFKDTQIFVSARGNVNDSTDPIVDLTSPGSRPEWGPTLSAYGNGEKIGEQVLSRVLTLVGRKKPSSARISSRWLSDTHCVLFIEAGELWIIDLNSKKGTFVDGERIKATRYQWGSTIGLGRVNIVCNLPAFETADNAAAASRQPARISAARSGSDLQDSDLEESSELGSLQGSSSDQLARNNLAGNWVESEPMSPIDNATTEASQDGTNEFSERGAPESFKLIREKLSAELDEMESMRNSADAREAKLVQLQNRLSHESKTMQIDLQSLNLARSQFENSRQQQVEKLAADQLELDRLRTELEARSDALDKIQLDFEKESAAYQARRDAWEAEQTEKQLEAETLFQRNSVRRARLSSLRSAVKSRHREITEKLADVQRQQATLLENQSQWQAQIKRLEAFLKDTSKADE